MRGNEDRADRRLKQDVDDRRPFPDLVACGAVALLLTLALAAPVLRSPATRLFGPEIVGRHHDPFTVMSQYQLGAVPWPYLQPATDLPGFVLARLAGPVRAYNALLLVTFPLAAVLAFAHARHLIGSRSGAMFAALLFAFSPFHLAHAAYHVHIAQVQWVPLAFLALWRLVDRPSVGRAALLGLAVLLAAASSFYLGFIVAVMLPIAALASSRRGNAGALAPLAWTAVAVAAGMLVVIGVVAAAMQTPLDITAAAFPLAALEPHSARAWSYLVSSIAHPWLGPRALAFWSAEGIGEGLLEQQVTIGVGVLALAMVPLVVRDRSPAMSRTALVLLVTAGCAVLVSLPPTVTVGPLRIVLPSGWLYRIAPMFRAYARFAIVASLAMTTLAGAGFAVLFDRRSLASRIAALALAAVAVFEYLPPARAWRNTLPTAGHEWIATRSEARVLDCIPPSPGDAAGLAMLMRHEVSFLAGPFLDCAEPGLGAKLAAFHYTHVLVRSGTDVWPWVTAGAVPDGTRVAARFGDAAVFEVIAPLPLLYVSGVDGFFPREFHNADSWRWLADRGSLTVVNPRAEPVDAGLDVDLEAFATTRIITVTLDEERVTTLTVEPTRGWHSMPSLRIPVGAHVIGFAAAAPSAPVAAPAKDDDRPLSIRLGGWRWRPGR
jgi:hypothetical protein